MKAHIFKLKELHTSEVSVKLEMPHGRDWRSILVSKEFVDAEMMQALDTMFNVVRAQEKLPSFRCCEFVIILNSKVCWDKGALAIGDNFGSVFLLGDCMHGPTCLGGIMKNASNMPELLVHYELLYSNYTKKFKTNM